MDPRVYTPIPNFPLLMRRCTGDNIPLAAPLSDHSKWVNNLTYRILPTYLRSSNSRAPSRLHLTSEVHKNIPKAAARGCQHSPRNRQFASSKLLHHYSAPKHETYMCTYVQQRLNCFLFRKKPYMTWGTLLYCCAVFLIVRPIFAKIKFADAGERFMLQKIREKRRKKKARRHRLALGTAPGWW